MWLVHVSLSLPQVGSAVNNNILASALLTHAENELWQRADEDSIAA